MYTKKNEVAEIYAFKSGVRSLGGIVVFDFDDSVFWQISNLQIGHYMKNIRLFDLEITITKLTNFLCDVSHASTHLA